MKKSKPGYKIVKSLFKNKIEIPEEWQLSNLGDVLIKIQDGNYGESYPRPDEFIEKGIPFLTSTTISNNSKIDFNKLKYIHSKKHAELKKAHIKSNDVIFTNRGANVGEVALVPKYLDDGNIGPQLTLLRSNSKKIVPSFLYWILQSNFIKQQIISNDAGSAMNFFGLERTSRFKLILPTLKEQQKITSVLSNVDSLILSYDGIIKFTTKLKKGMMQQLFVQGIGCRKFKIIKWFFGKKIKIPKTWNIFSIHDSHIKIIDGDRGNEYPKVNDFSTSDYCLFLSAKNVTIGGFVFDTCSFISQQKDKKLRKGKLSRGDIIITTRGTVGNIAYFDESVPYDAIRINSGMAILRNFNELIAQKFLYYLLKSPIVVKQLQFLTYGSVQSQLTIALIDSLKIILPSTIEEQHRIISKLDTINSQISDLKFKKNILENIKKGLMQKLLTGQIRVEINETN